MGLDTELVRLLLEARRSGVCFRESVTLGRQHYFVGNNETRRFLDRFGIDPDKHPTLFSNEPPRYSEPFWESLGVEKLETLDASDFEGATIVHDLNLPVPAQLVERFDVVCDAGTVEHVFNFPMAIKNCMQMVRPGGHLLLFTTANNYFGHGFYQFSPELFFRVLSKANGYQVERMVAVEYGPFRRRYEVTDPEAIRKRVNLINRFPVLLFVQARRTEKVPLLGSTPQQSDYVAMWSEADGAPGAPGGKPNSRSAMAGTKRFLVERLPRVARFLEAFLYSSWNRDFSFRNGDAFRRSPD